MALPTPELRLLPPKQGEDGLDSLLKPSTLWHFLQQPGSEQAGGRQTVGAWEGASCTH